MSTRVLVVGALTMLLAGGITGALGYAAWDARRDAHIQAEHDQALADARAETRAARQAREAADAARAAAERQLAEDSAAWEEERARLRRVAERARHQGDSIAAAIVAAFPTAQEMVRDLEATWQQRVDSANRDRDTALEEVAALRDARRADADVISTLRTEVTVAQERAEAAEQARVAAQKAAASREGWLKIGGGVTTLLLVTLALASR